MTTHTEHFENTVQLDNGLIIPASAALGKVLTSDAEGKATWGTGCGAWTEVTFGAKVQEKAGAMSVRVRLEQGGATARLRGSVEVKAGETLEEANTAFTLPAGFRPSALVRLLTVNSATAANRITNVASTGIVTFSATATAGQSYNLDGQTFNIT